MHPKQRQKHNNPNTKSQNAHLHIVKLPMVRLFHVLSTENQPSIVSCPKLRIGFSFV